MPIYTRRGDTGETDLRRGKRVSKASAAIEALGDIDELNAHLGLARTVALDPEIDSVLEQIQGTLLRMGAGVAGDQGAADAPAEITTERLESLIDEWDGQLPPLRNFILLGGSELAARLHLARAVCRRAERRLVALGEGAVASETLRFFNRLSDFLFVLARVANHR